MHLKEKSFHILSFILLAGVLAPSAQAERKFYYYNSSGNSILTAKYWTDPSTGTALSSLPATGDYWIKSGSTKQGRTAENSGAINWAELNIGSPSVAPDDWLEGITWWGLTTGRLDVRQHSSKYTFSVSNLIWWNGDLYTSNYDDFHTLKGTYTIRQADTGVSHRTYMNKLCQYALISATVKSSDDDVNAADAVWTFSAGTSSTASSTEARMLAGNSQFRMNGDFSAYKGSFNVTAAYQPFILYNGTIIGDPNTANLAALKLGTNAALAFAAEFEQGTTRGIQLTGDCAYLMTWETLANAYAVSYPISKAEGAIGQLVKLGPGTVTIDGAYAAGPIAVQEGTLVIGPDATITAGQPIDVSAGAKLQSYLPLSKFTITGEGEVERLVETLTVPFDPAAEKKTTPVELDTLDVGLVQPIALSSSIPLPQHEALQLPVVRYTGKEAIDADLFKDVTPKTSGLPRTSLAVTDADDGTGDKIVVLNVSPVVVSLKNFGQSDSSGNEGGYVTFNGIEGEEYWSDSRSAHSDADYLLTHNVTKISSQAFTGRSLTFGATSADQSILIRHNGSLPSVIIYPKTLISEQNNGSAYYTTSGSAFLVGEYGDDYTLHLQNKYGDAKGQTIFTAALSGAGTLKMSQNWGIDAGDGKAYIQLTGNNSAFLGKMTATGVSSETKRLELRFNASRNFGGALDEFKPDALTLSNLMFLRPLATVTISNDVNRGIYISNTAGFNVPANIALTCQRPIKLGAGGNIYKHGAGTLELGGALTLTDAASNKLVVRAGTVSALSDEAVAGLTLTATNDFTVSVSPRSTAVNGFGSVALTGDADPKITVAFDVASAEKGANYKLPICTVASDSGLTADSFVVQPARGYVCTLVSETVDETKTRWSLDCTRTGLIMVVR